MLPNPFPYCKKQCTNFFVGNYQYKARDENATVRTGESAVFDCPDGFYVETQPYEVNLKVRDELPKA